MPAIVFVAVIGLIDLREPARLFRVRPADGWTLLVTAGTTLFVGVQTGILVGVGFSLLVFVARSATPHVAELGRLPAEGVFRNVARFPAARRYRGVLLARPDAALYFANMAFLEGWLDDAVRRHGGRSGEPLRAVVLDFSAVNDLDAVALEALERRLRAWDGAGVALHLAGVKGPVRDLLARAGFHDRHPGRAAHLSLAHALECLGAEPEDAPAGPAGAAAEGAPRPAARTATSAATGRADATRHGPAAQPRRAAPGGES